MTPAVELLEVSRHYGPVRALDGVSLAIAEGEFFSMLGPSGSGKTTCLRLIAGFEQPSAGTVRLQGVAATDIPPFARDLNTVFQDYALFPHMSVRGNVEYGLMVKGVGRGERTRRADEALAMVALDGYAERRPSQLSGGQRQRVALARALVNRPRVLLLDEPLGALDLRLREQMQVELKSLQKKLGITFIYVTHDQGEALSMSDRVAVFNQGRLEQVDSPRNLYLKPATEFVARFVGGSNVIPAVEAGRFGAAPVDCSLRPENVRVHRQAESRDGQACMAATVVDVQYFGASSRLSLQLDSGLPLLSSVTGEGECWPAPGMRVFACWQLAAMVPLAGPRS